MTLPSLATSMERRCYVIAEAGVNHNGSIALAHDLIDAAHATGADAVKFQSFRASELVSRGAARAEYQTRNIGGEQSQLEMLEALELSFDDQRDLAAHAKTAGIEFLSTPFDAESLRFLVADIGVPAIKISSGDLTNAPLLLAAARTGVKLIISSGMATIEETLAALGVVAFGYFAPASEAPSAAAFRAAGERALADGSLRERVTVLHCTSEYPTPLEDVNLLAMDTLSRACGLPVGFSDHSEGILAAIAAAARGASVVEKHFTLDRALPGPDHRASLEPGEFGRMVTAIREVELTLGSDAKGPVPSEVKTKSVARRSLVAASDISAGEAFSERNLAVKRPGDGIDPMSYWSYLGKTATRDYARDELIDQ